MLKHNTKKKKKKTLHELVQNITSTVNVLALFMIIKHCSTTFFLL